MSIPCRFHQVLQEECHLLRFYEIDLHVEVKPPVKPLVNLGKQIVLYLSKNKLDDETK